MKTSKAGLPAPTTTPKPVSAASKDIFLGRYRQGDSVAAALERAGMTRAQLKRALGEDDRFKAAHREVEEALLDELEGVAHDLARKRDAATVRWILERRRPEKYGHKQVAEVTHKFESVEEIRNLSDEELRAACAQFDIDVESEIL